MVYADLLIELKTRLEIGDTARDEQLEGLLKSAAGLFITLRYPTSEPPVDPSGEPVIGGRWHSWIVRCAAEMFARLGAEGQNMSIELGVHRAWDAGTISRALSREVVPVAGVAKRPVQ